MEARSVIAIVRALDEAGVQFLVVGGLAVNAHGAMRFTLDADIVIGLEPDNAARGLRCLFAIGYRPMANVTPEEFADPQTREDWRQNRNMRALMFWSDEHRRTKLDIFIYEPFDFQSEWKTAPSKEVLPGLLARVISVPTLLRMKREAGRMKDLLDIEALEKLYPEHASRP